MTREEWIAPHPDSSEWWSDMESLNIPLMVINKENYIIGSNEALHKILKYSAQALKQKTLVQITHKNDRARETNTFIDMFYGKMDGISYLKNFVTERGETISGMQHLYPIRNQVETVYALVHVTRPELMVEEDIKTQIEPLIQKLKSMPVFVKYSDFGISCNKGVINQVNNFLDRLQKIISEPIPQRV